MTLASKIFQKPTESMPKRRRDSMREMQDEYGRICLIPPERIRPNRAQPRRSFDDEGIISLADSIRRYGIIQPLTVRCLPRPDDAPGCDLYELIAGERRLRAAKLICLREVPCIIIGADDRASAEIALIENIQREDLNIFEHAAAISLLIEAYDLTQEQVARRLSTSQSSIANKLRLLKLTPPEREMIITNGLSERHARALLRLDSPDDRLSVIEMIIARNLNVAATEDYVERLLCGPASKGDEHTNRLRKKLILKDIRIFYNTIDRAVDTMKAAGIPVTAEKTESDAEVSFVIRIPRVS